MMDFYGQLAGIGDAAYNILKQIVIEWVNGENAENCMQAVKNVYETMDEHRQNVFKERAENF